MAAETPLEALAEAIWDADFENAYADPADARRLAATVIDRLDADGLAVVPRDAAEAGEAVLRLPDAMWCISQRQPGRWVVNVYDYDADEDDAPFLSGSGPTLGAAVDAAIQEGADDGR